MTYPPLVPTNMWLFASYSEMILGLFETIGFNSFGKDISFSFDMLWLHKIMFPKISPDIMPPSGLSHKAPTALLCSLYTLEQKLPFQYASTPLFIEVMIESPSTAIQRLGFIGAFPNTPFLHSILPFKNLAKTTYFEQAHTTSSSAALNLML